ncbi:hypothetical protein J6590_034820 [Homalodisca vitripennis]|nr:hypothetical protein J6590_034820 [Homalodisca vitripennis]
MVPLFGLKILEGWRIVLLRARADLFILIVPNSDMVLMDEELRAHSTKGFYRHISFDKLLLAQIKSVALCSECFFLWFDKYPSGIEHEINNRCLDNPGRVNAR